ncbi:hypothetical protein QJS10_CPB18g01546 [Acorus calamus]|uniref:Glycosyl transferase CAP10 domain-containing protein n=1 Tax=Acorus calamus TaxID=4465 RepID=A0AAV9CMU1_ACOCL|nr:hypothetical protein QJS10_CPB18g01546 [Acorus calamus]
MALSNTKTVTVHLIGFPKRLKLSALFVPFLFIGSLHLLLDQQYYFRWIHEDMKPWKSTGITRRMVDRLARRTANFRLVILDGRVYVEKLKDSFQSRDVFTLWGVLQLLRRYPGRVPDLEIMFDTFDWPVVKSKNYRRRSGKARRRRGGPPPLFRYCGDESTLDIVFLTGPSGAGDQYKAVGGAEGGAELRRGTRE